MNVLEVGGCCAGVPARLADILDTQHVVFGPTGFASAKKTVQLGQGRRYALLNRIQYLPEFLAVAEPYDVLHFHYRTYLPQFADLPFWRALGKQIWISFHGSDIRGHQIKAANPLLRLADRIFVSTPDLLSEIPDAEWLPNPAPSLAPVPLPVNDSPVVVHCPTNPALKGTAAIEQAITHLKRRGSDLTYHRVTGRSHAATIEAMQGANIVIDQAGSTGMYGMVGVEAMAMGRPVLAHLSAGVQANLPPGCPAIPCGTTPESIAAAITSLLDAPGQGDLLGLRGIQYVARAHSPDAIRGVLA